MGSGPHLPLDCVKLKINNIEFSGGGGGPDHNVHVMLDITYND